MSNIFPEETFFTEPSGYNIGVNVEAINMQEITVVDLTVTGTINGGPVSGELVFTDSVQTLSNKSLVDDSTFIVDAADETVRLGFDIDGTAGTTVTLATNSTADHTYTMPDVIDSDFVMTEGDQVINGIKTFTDVTVTGLAVDSISEFTPNHGVYVDEVMLRYDQVISPDLYLATVAPVGSEANISLALIPKGTGALLADRPDIEIHDGGIVRGDYATDLQRNRNNFDKVAEGLYSVLLGGYNNRAGGDYSIVANGLENTADGDYSNVNGGQNNDALGGWSVVLGGLSSVSTGDYSISGGRRALAADAGSLVLADSTDADFSSAAVNSFNTRYSGGYNMIGGRLNLNNSVLIYTDGTASTAGAVTDTLYSFTMDNNSACLMSANVVATTAAGDVAVFTTYVKTKNVGGVVTVGVKFDEWDDSDAALTATTIDFNVSGTDVNLDVTGVGGETISWSGELKVVGKSF